MSRFLGLSEEEMSDNERMWSEEQGDVDKAPSEPAGLRSIGISPGGLEGMAQGLETPAPAEPGAEAVGQVASTASPLGGSAPAGATVAPAAPTV